MNTQGVQITGIEYGFAEHHVYVKFPHCNEEYLVPLRYEADDKVYFDFGGTTYDLDDFAKM